MKLIGVTLISHQSLERVRATVEMSFLQNSRSRFSFAAWAFESGKPTPVSRKLAAGYMELKNSMNGILPPQPMYRGLFPAKTSALASSNALFTFGFSSCVSNPLPPLHPTISTTAPYGFSPPSINPLTIASAFSALSVGGRRRLHLRVTAFLMELEASARVAGRPSMAVIVSCGSQVD